MPQLQKREKILAVGAGAALLIFLANQFLFNEDSIKPESNAKSKVTRGQTAQKSTTNPSAGKAEIAGAPSQQNVAPAIPVRKPNIVFSSWGRDPFAEAGRLAPVDTTAMQQMDLTLRGIIWRGDQASVLIGDYILKRGEKAGPYTVTEIKRDRVICRKGSEVITLLLEEDAK